MRFALRYDMRAPAFGAPAEALYQASVEQVAWADKLGFVSVYLAEHHGADDGYCPAPMIQASAMAAVSRQIRIHLSALLAVLHDPIRLAEDLAVLDLVSGGRIDITLGLGYRPHEYRMFGIEQRQRVAVLEQTIDVLEQAWTGEPFEWRGEPVVVRPRPVQLPRIPLYLGASTEAGALRAARRGDGFHPATPDLWAVYEAECERLGRPVGPLPNLRGPLFLHVSDDPDRDWALIGPHLLYTSQSNAEWAKERGKGATPYPPVQTVDELRAHPTFQILTPSDCIAYLRDLGDGEAATARDGTEREISLQPLMGGLDPEVAWASLYRFADHVLPALRGGIS